MYGTGWAFWVSIGPFEILRVRYLKLMGVVDRNDFPFYEATVMRDGGTEYVPPRVRVLNRPHVEGRTNGLTG